MADAVTGTWHYSLASPGSFSAELTFLTNDSANGTIFSAAGTVNGREVVGLSDFHAPLNRLSTTERPNLDGIHYSPVYPAQGYGVSVLLDDGTSVHLTAGPFPRQDLLAYDTSEGVGGYIQSTSYSHTQAVACFATGVAILTPAGEVPVETLRPGDLVVAAAGTVRPVRWVGSTIVRPDRHERPADVMPIRIRAGAFADTKPSRDLVISPGHALGIAGVLINACDLVNDATIVQEWTPVIGYHHVELDGHDLLLANGMPCESFADDGNKAGLEDTPVDNRLTPRRDLDGGPRCLPHISQGAEVATARQLLLDRALQLGWHVRQDPDLHIAVGGTTIGPVASLAGRYWFVLPPGCHRVRLLSASSRADRIAPQTADARRLGVAVRELRVDGRTIALDACCFGDGFHDVEEEQGVAWRWMDGDALLQFDGDVAVIELQLQHVAPTLQRIPAPETIRAAA